MCTGSSEPATAYLKNGNWTELKPVVILASHLPGPRNKWVRRVWEFRNGMKMVGIYSVSHALGASKLIQTLLTREKGKRKARAGKKSQVIKRKPQALETIT